MDYAELKRRLTDHLAGEGSTDFHTQAARTAAIKEAYELISDEWELWTDTIPTTLPSGLPYAPGAVPADFLSYATLSGRYNKRPPALGVDTDQPWAGQYPQVHGLITYYAAFRLYQDKGPEMYERSLYWKNLFTEESARVQRTVIRKQTAETAEQGVDERTYGGLIGLVRFYLDTAEMTPEASRRMFPTHVIESALKRAYREITVEHELSTAQAALDLAVEAVPGEENVFSLPADFLAPLSQAAWTFGHMTVLGAEYPYGRDAVYTPSFSVAEKGGVKFLTIQNYPQKYGLLYITYIAQPPALASQTSLPWNGVYPTGNKLIALRAVRDVLRGKRELYNLSRYWQNEYDREVVDFKRLLQRDQLAQANRVTWGHTGAGILEDEMGINRPDKINTGW